MTEGVGRLGAAGVERLATDAEVEEFLGRHELGVIHLTTPGATPRFRQYAEAVAERFPSTPVAEADVNGTPALFARLGLFTCPVYTLFHQGEPLVSIVPQNLSKKDVLDVLDEMLDG